VVPGVAAHEIRRLILLERQDRSLASQRRFRRASRPRTGLAGYGKGGREGVYVERVCARKIATSDGRWLGPRSRQSAVCRSCARSPGWREN